MLLLILIVAICAGLAVAFHDYILMFVTPAAGSIMVSQALFLFFPDTKARFNFIEGLRFVEVSNAANFLGAVVIVILTVLGSYVQWKSFQAHRHQNY